MLLANSRTGVSSSSPKRRNKRKEAATTVKKAKRGKAKDIKTKGKIGAIIEDSDGSTSRRKRYKQDDKDRKPDRGAEGEDKTPRRSASELAIEWIGDFCPDGRPHFLIGTHAMDGGSLLKCKNCKKHIWLPTVINDAAKLDRLIDHLGAAAGYCKFLDSHREAKITVAKLQDLWYARQRISDNEYFRKLVISVMENKEYDRMV